MLLVSYIILVQLFHDNYFMCILLLLPLRCFPHTGDREYALQCHGAGFAIIDITDPANTFRVQFVPMEGGGKWRDVATHFDTTTNKTFAYVGSQGTQGGGSNPNLFVFDLSHLSGDINAPNEENSNPIQETTGWRNIGFTDLTHTLNVARGLLFLNTARSSAGGCRVYDLTSDPWNPSFLFQTGTSSGRDCHDSFVRENINGKDILFTSDGGGRRERIYDITNVNATTNTVPPEIGTGTTSISGIYAHECWLSKDNRYLFQFDEFNVADIIVHDVSDLANPVIITRFQYSEQGENSGSITHNGQVRGNYLYAAYYEAGLRVFDISNPYLPVEVGKVETYRDPDGDGSYIDSVSGSYLGAWNTYPYLPSGNILVSDMLEGLYIVRADAPYDAPVAPTVAAQRDASDNVSLNWNAVQNVRGYSVERSLDGGVMYSVIAEHLVGNSYVDSSVGPADVFYKINAINGEGVGTSAAVAPVTAVSRSSN